MRWLTLPLFASVANAQHPAPAAEPLPVFTAAEAYAFALCQDAGRTLASPNGNPQVVLELLRQRVPHYLFKLRTRGSDGAPTIVDAGQPTEETLLYAFPLQVDDAARRAFSVRLDGLCTFTDNEAQVAWQGETQPSPRAALEPSGDGSPRSFLRTPGKDDDGNTWRPFDSTKQTGLRVRVLDERDQPLPLALVETRPANGGPHELAAVLPAGRARTSYEGDAQWRGIPARGLGFVVLDADGAATEIPASDVTLQGSTARVRVQQAAIARARMARNESAAIATLKNIASAQAQCQASSAIDADKNGAGEYGWFGELSGATPLRSGGRMSPPVLSAAFGRVQDGVVQRSGYCFMMVLPGKQFAPVVDPAARGAAGVDARAAEVAWCLYAWPIAAGESGARAFFVNQNGIILATANTDGTYSGVDKRPLPGAARQAGKGDALDAPLANGPGNDGQTWAPVR